MSRILRIRAQDWLSRLEAHYRNTFDPQSGLQYSEVTCHAGPMRADWIWKSLGSSLQLKTFRSKGPGCSSMINMAVRSVLTNLDSLTPECLETVPWQIGEILWKNICVHQLDSLHAWKVFAITYAEEEGESSLRSWRKVIWQPNMALPSYIKPITSTSFQWITSLTLGYVTCSRHELIHLSKLANLGTLTIGNGVNAPDTGLDEGIVRAWARSATDTGTFSMLRVLACLSQPLITPSIFNHLNSFALLSIFLVEDCGIGHHDEPVAQTLGWKFRSRKEFSDVLVSGSASNVSWETALKASFHHGSRFAVEALTETGVEAINRLPWLNFSIGVAPANIKLDGQNLLYFQREALSNLMKTTTATQLPPNSPSKRHLQEVEPGHQVKKRTMRVSKQKVLDDILIDLTI